MHGFYVVERECARHALLSRFVDDEPFQAVCAAAVAVDGSPRAVADRARGVLVGCIALSEVVDSEDEAVSHTSAAVVHGLPTIGTPAPRIEVSSPRRTRRLATLWRRQREIPADDRAEWRGLTVTAAPRTVLDMAEDLSVESGVIAADAFMRESAAGMQELLAAAERTPRLSASRRVARVLGVANGEAESPAESICAYGLHALGLSGFRQQVEISDPVSGEFIARVDFLLADGRTVIEVDGAVKYRSTRHGGFADGADALVGEKRRQLRLERLGFRVIRVMWRDVVSPSRFRAVLVQAGMRV